MSLSVENKTETEFDEYSESYDAALAEGLSLTGEDKDYFARGRIAWLARSLTKLNVRPRSVIDFGCGTGSTIAYLRDLIGVESAVGIEVSSKYVEVARRNRGSDLTSFILRDEYQPYEQFDLAFCNGVFHHVPRNQRLAELNLLHCSLKPGAVFAFWENNPYNPGTRYVMSRLPFDKDAITIRPAEARRMLRVAGFEIISTDFLFIFPRALRLLRGIEPLVSRLPLGGQYQILCRKPWSEDSAGPE